MCGIAGIVSAQTSTNDWVIVKRMTDALRHRGPDALDVVQTDSGVFGHTRLAIIDLDASANQPMFDERRRYVIVYNGELYNYRELKKQLTDWRFRTQSDTEVVLAAFALWGESCVERFNGMFAFAIWDSSQRRLFVARDRLGKKPLYWARTSKDAFVFASEPRALSLHPDVGKHLETNALTMFLRLNYTVGEHTLYRGVHRFPAAHYGWVTESGQLNVHGYWDLASCFNNKRNNVAPLEAIEELQHLLADAVDARLVSDAPLGAFLSGGLDSSAIASAMADIIGPTHTKTFSIGFDQDSFDELSYAHAVASHLGVDHTQETQTGHPVDLARQLDIAAQEPIADTSFLPMLQLAEMTRKHVTVALSGDGADELFLGYSTYFADLYHRWSSPLLRPLQPALSKIAGKLPVSHAKVSLDYKVRQWISGLDLAPRDAHVHWREIFSKDEITTLLNPDVVGQIDDELTETIFMSHFDAVSECHYLDQASYVDIKTWLADDILVKVDRSSMAHSLEVRAPFLDHRIVEFAASLPVEQKLSGGVGKRVLRASQRERLPAQTLRRAKSGFNAPVSDWFNGPLRATLIDTLQTRSIRNWFSGEALDALIDDHVHQRRDNGLKLLSLYSLARWLDA